jgi:hypothetical protein
VDEAAAAAAHAAVAAVVVAVSAPAVTAAAAAAAAACKLTLVAPATRPQRLAPSAGRTAWLCTRHTSPRVRARGRHCRRPPLPAACASSPVPPRAGLQQETQETQEGGRQVPERVAACARPARTLSGAHILHVRRAWAVMCSARQAALRTTRELPHVASCLLRSMSSTRASQKQHLCRRRRRSRCRHRQRRRQGGCGERAHSGRNCRRRSASCRRDGDGRAGVGDAGGLEHDGRRAAGSPVPADGPWPKKRRAGLRMRSGPRNSWAVLGSGVAAGPHQFTKPASTHMLRPSVAHVLTARRPRSLWPGVCVWGVPFAVR